MTVRDEVLALAKEFGFINRAPIYVGDTSIRLIRGADVGAPMMWIYLTEKEYAIRSVIGDYYGSPIGNETHLWPTLAGIRTWMKENA